MSIPQASPFVLYTDFGYELKIERGAGEHVLLVMRTQLVDDDGNEAGERVERYPLTTLDAVAVSAVLKWIVQA